MCLGAQLIAKTLGAEVRKGPRKEVGWLTVEPNAVGASSPVRHFAGVPTVQWHGDTRRGLEAREVRSGRGAA